MNNSSKNIIFYLVRSMLFINFFIILLPFILSNEIGKLIFALLNINHS